MAKYQIWGFNYLMKDLNGINVINDSFCETIKEFNIPCFDGVAYFKVGDKFYTINYPSIRHLTAEQKEFISVYCGHEPSAGEYGVICGALGVVAECTQKTYEVLCRYLPIKKKDVKLLGYAE